MRTLLFEMTKKYKSKKCLLLEGLGIDAGKADEGIGICQVCELARCVYDYPGRVSKRNKEILLSCLRRWQGQNSV